MKKTLAKAIIFAVVVGGICYQSGPVYAGEPWTNNGRNIIEIIDKKIEGYDGLKDPTVQHTLNGGDYHGGHDEQCEEDANHLYVGDVAKMKDWLVENDKILYDRINAINTQIEGGALTDTVTTVGASNDYINVDDDGSHNYTVGLNEDKLIETIQANDNDTITTVGAGNDYITVDVDGNHNYTVAVDEDKLIQTIADQDRYVNGGSISTEGKISLTLQNVEAPIELTGQLKDAQLTKIDRDKEAGTATLVVTDGYTNEVVRTLEIKDIASKEQNDKDHKEFREHFSELDHRVDSLDSRVDKVGAGAAALAALHPMDFDPDDKLTFAAGYGNYKGKNAAAVGAFYRPDEKVMLSVGGTFGNGENMVNAGISFSLDRTARVSNSRTAMAKEIVDLRANVANLTALVGQLTAGMGGTIEMDRMKLFPDVPENHWAYEYIGRLAAAGIVEGYPDGMFNGNRMMSRYEFAAMLYRALEKGVKLDHKLVREFEPEMGRIHVARISGADGDRGKIERVRVYGGDNRDHYGSKLK